MVLTMLSDSPSLSTPGRNATKVPKRKRVKANASKNAENGSYGSTLRSQPHPIEYEIDLFTGRPVAAPPKGMRRRISSLNETGSSFLNSNSNNNAIVRSDTLPSITDYTENVPNTETIRCVCGVNDDGGVVMVQW